MLEQPLSQRLREIRETHAPPAQTPEPVQEHARRPPLGELLMEKGLISETDLKLALYHQRENGRPLGQILIGMDLLTEADLTRALTEQHTFNVTTSLRRRLSPVVQTPEAEDEEADEAPEAERYLLREPGIDEPLHVSDSFLDAADIAFELIEERDPLTLEIIRVRGGETEHLWSYSRNDSELAS